MWALWTIWPRNEGVQRVNFCCMFMLFFAEMILFVRSVVHFMAGFILAIAGEIVSIHKNEFLWLPVLVPRFSSFHFQSFYNHVSSRWCIPRFSLASSHILVECFWNKLMSSVGKKVDFFLVYQPTCRRCKFIFTLLVTPGDILGSSYCPRSVFWIVRVISEDFSKI